jgi:crotonobetainyl-CoA:carnitine CoA-transferase CaiB-like acyl-CoA transferase
MLSPMRVLDLSDERGIVCGWLLGELGADVICLEPPGGSRARQIGPFADDDPGAERSLFWWAYARNKRSVTLDLASEAGCTALRRLAATADVLIESQTPGVMAERGLGYEDLANDNPRLVYVSITPFGQTGPKARWAATDLTVLAAGGPLWLTGDDDRAPVRVSVPQAFAHAAAEGAAAALVALHERHRSGLGQHVDISAQQAVTLATQSDIVSERVGEPGSRRFAGGGKIGPVVVRLVFPARDGHVSITYVFGSAIGPATARLMDVVHADGFCDAEMRDQDWVGFGEHLASGAETIADFEAAKEAVAAWTASKTKAELLTLAMDRGLLIAPVSTARDVVDSPQLAERGYFEALTVQTGATPRTTRQLGPFARFGGIDRQPARPAPRVGEHSEVVLAEWEESMPPEIENLETGRSESNQGPLSGLKVLDFMWAIAGPMSTRMLADYGADVIRVESTTRLDACRTMRPYVGAQVGAENSSLFHGCNASKRMITLDLTNPDSHAVIADLVRWADVVTESFTPGTLAKLGFGYASLCEMNPTIILLSTCLMGQSGPLASFSGYGNLAAAITGFHELTGWPDRDPAGPFGAYTDYIAPKFNASAILAAVEYRRRTGLGQHIDMSQAETALHFLAPAILATLVNGSVPTRVGNRDARCAPHGCYRVAGDDAWIAIAVEDDPGWRALCHTLGCPELAKDARFANGAARVDRAAELDEIVAARVADCDGVDLEARLQAEDIACHRVLDSAALLADPQLRHRGHFVEIGGTEEPSVVEGPRSQLSRTPGVVRRGVPTLGRDNFEVLEEVLGYDGDRISELVIAGVLE